MSQRLDLGPLLRGVSTGLRHRSTGDIEAPDRSTRFFLTFIPVATVLVTLITGFKIREASSFIAGFSILAAVLLATFTQLASWRSQLSLRSAVYGAAERPPRRAIDEAVAHTLWASLLSIAATLFAVITSLSFKSEFLWGYIAVVATAGVLAISSYLLLTFMIIVNLLWDGYTRSSKIEEDAAFRQREEILRNRDNNERQV